jgi:uncharacterized membrane protein YtjA (UPF0391 family)
LSKCIKIAGADEKAARIVFRSDYAYCRRGSSKPKRTGEISDLIFAVTPDLVRETFGLGGIASTAPGATAFFVLVVEFEVCEVVACGHFNRSERL